MMDAQGVYDAWMDRTPLGAEMKEILSVSAEEFAKDKRMQARYAHLYRLREQFIAGTED